MRIELLLPEAAQLDIHFHLGQLPELPELPLVTSYLGKGPDAQEREQTQSLADFELATFGSDVCAPLLCYNCCTA